MANLPLFITNTLSGKKEEFISREPGKVKLYVCGITPYDYPHIGHGRVYVTFDVLFRLLKFLGFNVIYARNFTDIDDKLLNRAEKELGSKFKYKEVADKYIDAFTKNMNQLNCLSPDYEPRVTEVIPEIKLFVQNLIDSAHAYQVNGDVYFDVCSLPTYGKLSKRNLDDLQCGVRVEIDERKRSPLDFALWKSEEENTFWDSPWGFGRPGWHIECSAMAKTFLGDQIDIHGGGMDLIFPHHENEIAQSEAFHNKEFSKYWMHNAFVRVNEEKMSKSLGNFFTLNDVFESFDPMIVRYYYLNHSYTSPLDFSFDELCKISKSYNKLSRALSSYDSSVISRKDILESGIGKKMLGFLLDDLNTAGLLGVVFENLKDLGEKEGAVAKAILQQLLGLTLNPIEEKKSEITPKIEKLLKEREQARADKNWKRSDEIRDELKCMGIEVQDKKI
jgi:cysteinyl-tRNA synthetase